MRRRRPTGSTLTLNEPESRAFTHDWPAPARLSFGTKNVNLAVYSRAKVIGPLACIRIAEVALGCGFSSARVCVAL